MFTPLADAAWQLPSGLAPSAVLHLPRKQSGETRQGQPECVDEPPRFSRRPFGLSYAAIRMASCIA